MSGKDAKLPILILLAIVFTVALTFATLELPLIIDGILHGYLDGYFYDWEHAREWWGFLRVIGYACIVVVIGLIVVGFKTGRARLSSLGSIAFFLPTFGYFAASMWTLAGLGLLRVLWTPFMEWYEPILKLGDIVFLPYLLVMYPFRLLGVDVRMPLALLTIGIGLFIFCSGTVAWFYGKSEDREIVDFWIYKYSRHPQYLGFILWSYGVMLLAALSPFPRGGYNPGPSLPWLISVLVMVCVALKEEIEMTKTHGERYLEYQSGAPFMLPLPRFVSAVTAAPIRILYKKSIPETGKEIACAFLVYTAILTVLSLPFLLLNWPPGLGWYSWP